MNLTDINVVTGFKKGIGTAVDIVVMSEFIDYIVVVHIIVIHLSVYKTILKVR